MTTRARLSALATTTLIVCSSTGCVSHTSSPAFYAPRPSVSESSSASSADANQHLAQAVKSAAALQWVHAEFSSTGVADLMAQSYIADITTSPDRAVRGTADLKINGAYSQTDFQITAGHLWLQGTNGEFTDAGSARGKFDPSMLLDPSRGISALLAAVTSAKTLDDRTNLNGHDALQISGTLPTSAAAILVPASSLGAAGQLPIMLWLKPDQSRLLEQLIITISGGSLTLALGPGEPFAIPQL